LSTTRRSQFEPDCYLPSKSHPDYQSEETWYVVSRVFSDKKIKKWQKKHTGAVPFTDIEDLLASYLGREIERGWHSAPVGKGKVTFSGTEKRVIKAIKLFGMDALRLSVLDEQVVKNSDTRSLSLESLKLKDQLGAVVCNAIRYWREQVVAGRSKERRKEAASWIKEAIGALVPETRGKRGEGLKLPLEVGKFYYKELFRLCQIKHALKGPQKNKSEKVKAAGKNYGLDVKLIREFWGLDEDACPIRGSGPFTVKDMARELTARHFEITQQTISNILAL